MEIPPIGYYDDFGVVVPKALVRVAFPSFAQFNDEFFIVLEKLLSPAHPELEFPGLTLSFRDKFEGVIAGSSLPKERSG